MRRIPLQGVEQVQGWLRTESLCWVQPGQSGSARELCVGLEVWQDCRRMHEIGHASSAEQQHMESVEGIDRTCQKLYILLDCLQRRPPLPTQTERKVRNNIIHI